MEGIRRRDYARLLIAPVAFAAASFFLWFVFVNRPALKNGITPVSTFYGLTLNVSEYFTHCKKNNAHIFNDTDINKHLQYVCVDTHSYIHKHLHIHYIKQMF